MELAITGMATGGDGVGRDQDGRTIFVRGAVTGDVVHAAIELEKKRYAKAALQSIVEPSPDRRTPPCPHVARGCGGCGWQHIVPEAQRRFKVGIVSDALSRQGGVSNPRVELGPPLPGAAFRTTLRMVTDKGQAAFRRSRSHDAIAVDSCLVAHNGLVELIADGVFDGCSEVTLRIGARTDERLVLATPRADAVVVPDDVIVVGRDELERGRHAWHHEIVDGRSWRISATSFFQARPDGAEAIIDAIAAGLDGTSGTLVDLCCGVGLLGGALANRNPGRWKVLGVERHKPAVVDARHNLGDLDDVRVIRASLKSWRPSPADVVIADPARDGLGAHAVDRVAETGANVVALVSCDPASLGRDAHLLKNAGYDFEVATLIDLFPQTPHIETVSIFKRMT